MNFEAAGGQLWADGGARGTARVMHLVTVGEVDGDSAVISMGTEPPHVFRLPLALLPPGTAAGNIILLQTMRDSGAVQERERGIRALQAEIRARFRR